MKSIYFSHDVDAFSDPKIRKLRGKYGMEGYGLYWVLLEEMRKSDEVALEYSQDMFDAWQADFRMTFSMSEFVNDCIKFGLFELDSDGSTFYSHGMRSRVENVSNINKKRSDSMKKRAELESDSSRSEVDYTSTSSQLQVDSESTPDQLPKSKSKNKNTTPLPPSQGDAGAVVGVDCTAEQYASICLRFMSPQNIQELAGFMDEDGIEPDVVRRAVDETCANGKRSWSYCRAILQRYAESDVHTLADALELDEKRRKPPEPEPETDDVPWVGV